MRHRMRHRMTHGMHLALHALHHAPPQRPVSASGLLKRTRGRQNDPFQPFPRTSRPGSGEDTETVEPKRIQDSA